MARPFEIFYTFPQLQENADRLIIHWIPDAKLRQYINRLQKQSQVSEAVLARHLLETLRNNPEDAIAKKLLVAFLASFSANVAWRVKINLETLNKTPSDINALFQDLFQTALEAALHPLEFFKNFNQHRSEEDFWYASFKSYTRHKIEGQVYDRLRKTQGFETLKHSNLGLAARASKIRVQEALQFVGQAEAQVTKLILAWKCFQEVKKALKIDTNSLQQEHFDAIALRFNYLCGETYPKVNGKTIEAWLKQIGAAVRSYVDRELESLDTPRYKQEDEGTISWGDEIPDPSLLLGWDTLLFEEMKQDVANFKNFLHYLIDKLNCETQELFVFIHGLQMVQTQIAEEIEKNASTVSRHYKKVLQQLLSQLAEWAKQYQQVNLTSETLNNMKVALKEQLETYYTDAIDRIFQETFNTLSSSSWQFLKLYYLRGFAIPNLVKKLLISQQQVQEMLTDANQFVQEGVANRIENRWHFFLKLNGTARLQILTLIPEKFKNYVVIKN
ncbi:MAG: hypothetical protein IGS49_08745 [Chlorogloeopsis fritschii C42_A2020_084]|uniref:hypothetical protein n=1 Tax=Chlorogloeopsis fritschii TaxID=1124 RepID=UPI0019EE6332|nr:hypothetical protein [Chlorogloeopsis fritschii]MBF2005541.1 hypothetical protein [Chlorogloeopsis fritschii C42_A2020_084]